MAVVELKNISNYICRDINLRIFDREILVLLGPNGAGKTTLLNVIAGLVGYRGSVLFDGVCVDNVPAGKRNIGYLFQNLILFPHMDVYSNIAYGLRARGYTGDSFKSRVDPLLEMLNLRHLLHRYPANLSGGEKQRVALARALAPAPEVLLLDEPMSSLDFKTAKFLRAELKQLQKELGFTAVYVTHNLDEAREMADRICIINNGSIEQVGGPERVLKSRLPFGKGRTVDMMCRAGGL